jgi:PPOX class probable F420-dependent enzyme
MKQRDRVAMTAEEVTGLLAGSRKVQLATINPDGTPHLVTMYYVVLDGQITFWTYRASQKARNLARDPRVTCLVETGEQYFDLRGVQVRGVVRRIEDPAQVREIGRRIAGLLGGNDQGASGDENAGQPAGQGSGAAAAATADGDGGSDRGLPSVQGDGVAAADGDGGAAARALASYVEHAARKRVGYTVRPDQIVSWDHAKLLPPGD